jgi:hypothetical protein
MTMSTEREILYVDGSLQAEPLLAFLHSQGVAAHLRDADDAGGLDPALAFAHGSAIVVAAHDAERARQLLAEYQSATPVLAPELTPEG